MKTFKQQILTEAFPSGAQWEQIICCAYNMKSKGVNKDKAITLAGIKDWNKKFDLFLSQAEDIVDSAFGKSPKNVMEHYGSSSANLTKGWDGYFIQTTGKSASASTKTPKTDMYIGKQHISLKKIGGSQLMSGGKGETLATLAFAFDNVSDKVKTKELTDAWDKLSKDITDKFITTKLPPKTTVTMVKKDIKAGKKDSFTNLVSNTLDNNNDMTIAIKKILEGKEIKESVVHEAISGRSKFDSSLPISTHMMVFDPKGSGVYSPIDSKLISHYASKTQFNISFKSAGTGKKTWSALKAIYTEDLDVSLDNIINESINETDKEMLTEGLVGMGLAIIKKWVGVVLNKVWNKIKLLFSKGLGYGLGVLNKTMDVDDVMVKF
jgi:hypothetical protein